MLDSIINNSGLFLLIFGRVVALIMTTPILSSSAVSRVAKIALGGFTAFAVFPTVNSLDWNVPAFGLEYVFLLIGEIMIGIVTGFFVNMVFATFSSAGQFFSYQMGFGASEVYDTLAQIENPLMGQFLNLAAMFVFLQVDGFRQLFLGGVLRSFQSLNAPLLMAARDNFLMLVLKGLTGLFLNGLVISMPVIVTLFLITLATGLLSKAAPQINLLSEGLPVTIIVSFVILFLSMPVMIDLFINILNSGYKTLQDFFIYVGGIDG